MRLTEIFDVLTRTLWVNPSYKKDLLLTRLAHKSLPRGFFGCSSALAAAPVALNRTPGLSSRGRLGLRAMTFDQVELGGSALVSLWSLGVVFVRVLRSRVGSASYSDFPVSRCSGSAAVIEADETWPCISIRFFVLVREERNPSKLIAGVIFTSDEIKTHTLTLSIHFRL